MVHLQKIQIDLQFHKLTNFACTYLRLTFEMKVLNISAARGNMGQVTKVRLSCYLVLLSVDSKTR